MPLFGDNLLRSIRLQNIFDQDGPIANATTQEIAPQQQTIELDDYDVDGRMRQLYQPETQAGDRLNALLTGMPRRENPSLWRKIAAIGTAFSNDPNAVEQTLYSPYHRKMQDWKTELDPAIKAAELERNTNVNLRSMANNVVSQEMADRRLSRQLNRDRVLGQQGDLRLQQQADRYGVLEKQANDRIGQANARIEIARQLMNGGRLEVDDAGNARVYTRDGRIIEAVGNYLSAEEKAQLKAQYPSGGQRDRFRTEVIDDPDNPGRKILVRINLDTNEVTPVNYRSQGAPPNIPPKTVTPVPKADESTANQELGNQRGVVNRANQIKNSNPQWSKWIKIDKGQVTVTTPGIFSGPTQSEYKTISDAIFGRGNSSNNNQQPGQTALGSKRSDGKVYVKRKRDGQTGWVTNPDPSVYEVK